MRATGRSYITPYHYEGIALGADVGKVKKLSKNISSAKLREIWDYREAGLTIDEARGYITAWQRPVFHRFRRGEKQQEAFAGDRIIIMMQVAARIRKIAADELARIMLLSDTRALAWDHAQIRWAVGARSIVTCMHQSATWAEKKHWPTSTSTSYTSHLIRITPIGSGEAYNANQYQPLEILTEKKRSHNLRGNWQSRIAEELLGVDYRPEKTPAIFYKKVAVCPAFSDTVFASVYDGSPYEIGVKRTEKVLKNHNGGLYCYKIAEEAKNAPFPAASVLQDAEKCILAVEVRGKRIKYGNGKYAVSEMIPIEIIQ